jgi:hypothetical protein
LDSTNENAIGKKLEEEDNQEVEAAIAIPERALDESDVIQENDAREKMDGTVEDKDTEDQSNSQVIQRGEADDEAESFVHRILNCYFDVMYKIRYVMIAAIVGTFVFVMITALKIELPNSSDVRLLNSNVEFEVNYQWRQNLLSTVLEKKAGSQAYVVWGLKATDTGNQNNPSKFLCINVTCGVSKFSNFWIRSLVIMT